MQKYCNYCLEEQRKDSFKPKHAVKCHKCKERNLALLLPFFTPCPICASSNIRTHAVVHTLNQTPENGLKCASLKSSAETLEQTLDTLMVNIVNESCDFIDRFAGLMTSGEASCYELSTNLEFNNNVYGHTRLLEVVELFLKHSQSVARKQVLMSMIGTLNKKMQGFRYVHVLCISIPQ